MAIELYEHVIKEGIGVAPGSMFFRFQSLSELPASKLQHTLVGADCACACARWLARL